MHTYKKKEYTLDLYSGELCHYGIKGQKWGVRRWQNKDGSLTPEGRVHYNKMATNISAAAIIPTAAGAGAVVGVMSGAIPFTAASPIVGAGILASMGIMSAASYYQRKLDLDVSSEAYRNNTFTRTKHI